MILGLAGFVFFAGLFYFFIVAVKKIISLREQLANTKELLMVHQELSRQSQKDLDELKNNVEKKVLYDVVTSLPKRQVFNDYLARTLNLSKRHQLIFSVLSLEIDEFKAVENVFGSEVSDEILNELALRMGVCIRKVDMLARLSDGRFVILLSQIIKPEAAVYIAQRLLEVISSPFRVNNQDIYLNANIGISVFPGDGDQEKALLNNADVALQVARSFGLNTYRFYHQDMQAVSKRELTLSSSLCSETIYQEFVIHYQPQINTDSRKITTLEALLRWQHPDLGLVGPLEFLKLAENNRRMMSIGEWVLRKACKQFLEWKERGLSFSSISVNVSMHQLENPHFSFSTAKILQEVGMDPSLLVLEISESVLSPKLDVVEKTLHMLKHLGVKIAIDHFGTGNLSLQHLRRFPVDFLKIDGSLIREITVNKESEEIVKMMIMLANSLKLSVVAEGVETLKQKEMLLSFNCFLMQGFLFSKPLLAVDFSDATLQNIIAQI
ncbi:MAG: bifunctional diguanylate cyclase/phosphodiesterase [Gammaproteobacteria bacterium]|nr:bifunctional diguanylate cyclase/phosphodiesterase [Gammaproteobacteria bacterium]